MVDKKAQTIGMKKFSVIALLVLCVVLVMAVPQFINILTPTGVTGDRYIELEWNITEANLKEVKYNWNGTNYTIFDDSTILIYNFNNKNSIGDNSTHIVDASGNGNNATLLGNPVYNSTNFRGYGNYDSNLIFDGVDDAAVVNDLATPDEISVSFWVKVNNATHDFLPFFESPNFKMKMRTKTDTHMRVEGRDDTGSSANREFTDQLEFGNWTHFVGMINSTTILLYKNGVLSGTWPFTGNDLNNSIVDYGIMKPTTVARYINGSMDELRVFNRVLTETEIQKLYFTNLEKLDSDKWNLYVNQTKDFNDELDLGVYSYYVCATNSSDVENCTSTQQIEIQSFATITANFSNNIGNIRNDFYGTNIHGNWFTDSPPTPIDTNNDGLADSGSNVTWHREKLLESGIKVLRMDTFLDKADRYSNTTDPSGVNFTGNLSNYVSIIKWAYENDIKVLVTATYMPNWLADNSSGDCTSLSFCPATNSTKWANIVIDFINRTTENGTYLSAISGVEIWNEPYGTFFMGGLSFDNITKATEYVSLYNATYDRMKEVYPNLAIGGSSARTYNGTVASPNMVDVFLSNMSNKMQFFSFHPYSENYIDTPMILDIDAIVSRCDFYSANCSSIIVSEWNTKNDTIKNESSLSDIYAINFAETYMDSLNKYSTNISMVNYQWSERFSYGIHYPEYPEKWHLLSEPSIDNELTIAYNTTKSFGNYHSAGSTVYTSSTTHSAVKTVSSKNSNEFYITVINTDTEARNITVDTGGALTKLFNLETGEEFSSDTGVFTVGVMDSFEILYLGYQGIEGGLVARLNLNENSGTTAHDTSGNSNNGIITGAIWFTDGVLITLTNIVDYTINAATGLFTIVNNDYSWGELLTSWTYVSGESCPAGVNPSEIGENFGSFITGLLSFLGIMGVILGVLWLVMYVNKLFSKGGLNDIGQAA